jgi:hypothetical protein
MLERSTNVCGTQSACTKITNSYREEFNMNKIQSTIAAAFVTVSFVSAAFAADATKPVVPAPPIVASQPAAVDAGKPVVPAPPVVATQVPAADAAAKKRADKLRERNKSAKALSESGKKAAAPVSPAVADSAARRVNRLKERNVKARENSKTMNSNLPKAADPVAAPPAVR